MLRDENLIPLSRQHQHALALCVRIERASPIREVDFGPWQSEIAQLFQSEIRVHFAAEEQVVFPAARRFSDLVPLVDELLADHAALRDGLTQAEAGNMSAEDGPALARRLSTHIRKEERQLFERMQELMNQEELSALGEHLEAALKESAQSCILPSDATKLRPVK